MKRLLYVDYLALLELSDQGFHHALHRFSADNDKIGIKISTKQTEVLCLSRNPGQCMLNVSSNTLQQVEKFKSIYMGWYSRVTEGRVKRLIHGSIKKR